MHISLQRITAEHFRAIQDQVSVNLTKLPAGLYFIAGRNEVEPRLGANGAAKSTLFVDLVYWVLTGKTARAQRPGADIENWHSSDPPYASLQFKVDEKLRTIERTRKPISLKLDGRSVQQEEVDDLLPLAEAALRRTLLIDQFSQKFLDLRPEEKSRIFSETLNLDLWIQASNRASGNLTQLEGKSQRARTRQASLESAIKEVRDQLEQATTSEKQFDSELNTQLKGLRTQYKEKANVSSDCEEGVTKAREYANELSVEPEIELNNLKLNSRHLQREYTNAVAREASVTNQIQRLTGQLEVYIDTKVCPECGQEVTDEHLIERRATLTTELKEFKQTKKLTTEHLQKVNGEIETTTKRVTELNAELVEYHQRHGLLKVALEKAQSARREVNNLKSQIDQLKQKENPFTKMRLHLDERLKQLRVDRTAAKEDADILDAEAEIYRFWQKGFRDIRLEQIDTTLMELEIAVNRHAVTLGLDGWDIQFSTEREKSGGGVAHAFTVSLYPPGQNTPVSWESYSGGESQRLQLAVTFGLAEILLARGGISTDFEVLDEPTIHMAVEGIEDLLECLRERATDTNRRIFVIDHHALSVAAFDGVLTVVKDKNGVHLETDAALSSLTQKERERL